MTSQDQLPSSRPPAASLVNLVLGLRESVDAFVSVRQTLDATATLAETRALVEAACAAVQRIHETTQTRSVSPGLIRAEAFALRELAASRRHQDLASKSGETCQAACELAVRSVSRALDTLLAELIPFSLIPDA